MPMYKAAKQLSMITPGQNDADILPGSNSAGLILDYRAIQVGDNSQVAMANDVVEVEEELLTKDEKRFAKKIMSLMANLTGDDEWDNVDPEAVFGFAGACDTPDEAAEYFMAESIEPYHCRNYGEANDLYSGNFLSEHYNNVPVDENKARGAFVGSKEEGFELKRNMCLAFSKRSYPDFPAYSDPQLYTQVSERNPATPAFNIFETYYSSDGYYDEVETNEDVIETEEKKKQVKTAFVKTSLSYDSHPIIQELIKIPAIKNLIDQQASGHVDQIIVTTPGADVHNTQQKMNVELEPIGGSPFGHMFMSEDPNTHQKKPLDKIVRIDRVTDQYGTLSTIIHEILHHKNPNWSESQVESEAQNLANSVKQHIKNAKTNLIFVKSSLKELPMVKCELADTYQKQVIGLQNHSSLDPQSGLLFTYSRPQPLTFWMGKVAFPIDIIFADNNNKIVQIYRNCKPNSQELYSCANASKVIEVVGSYCAFHDLNVDDHVFYADDKEDFTQHIMKKIIEAKLIQQKELDMENWSIKIIMKKNPNNKRFLQVTWKPEDYKIKKADILVNPDPALIKAALKEMSLGKLLRHALLHILAGEKRELPEDKEQELITSKLFSDRGHKS